MPASTASLFTQTFDVCDSFAGEQRALAEAFVNKVTEKGLTVINDGYYKSQLWGTDLPVVLDEIYRKRSRYCVAFVSEEYTKKMWPSHERKSAQARALAEPGYLLPIKVEDVELPGMAPTVGHVSLADTSIDEIADLFIEQAKGS